MTNIAIIGAGLAGLSAAHLLQGTANVTVFEKARGVGGRMATRRAEPYMFDHGAQYFTARSQAFENFIAPLIQQGVIARWNARYVRLDGSHSAASKNWADEEPRYVGVPGMNQVAKHLANGINVLANTKITAMQHHGKWQLSDEQGQHYDGFDWVICTAPSPQALALLPSTFAHYSAIQAVQMRACFSLMIGLEQPLPLGFDAAHVTKGDLAWIAVNSDKPARPEHFSLMVHCTDAYAEAHINDDRDDVMAHLIAETSRVIGHDLSRAAVKTLHGWRYASSVQRHEALPVLLDSAQQLAACGDWCLRGRVEDAFTAAYQLVAQLKADAL